MYKWYQALVQDLNENVDESLAWLTQKTEDVIELNCKVVKKVAPPPPTFLHKPLLSTPFLAKNFVPSPSQVTQFLEGPRVVGVGVQLCKPTVPCSALLSNNYVIIKACGRNIKGSTNLPYSKKVNLTVFIRLSFQGLHLFLGKEKSGKCAYFGTGCCFIQPPLIFAV